MFQRAITTSIDWLPQGLRRRIKDIPVISWLQRVLVNRFLDGSTFEYTVSGGPARGVRFRVSMPTDKQIWTGTYEPVFAAALRAAVRPSAVCYDIGGYHGYMAGVFAAAGAKLVVVCEPNPDNLAILQALKDLNPALPIELEPVAVGAHDGVANFALMQQASMGKLADSGFQPDATVEATVPVRVSRLDTLVSQRGLPAPDVIKIDVEGAEVEVLSGARDTLLRYRPSLFIEMHTEQLARECDALLRDTGYKMRPIVGQVTQSAWPAHYQCEPL